MEDKKSGAEEFNPKNPLSDRVLPQSTTDQSNLHSTVLKLCLLKGGFFLFFFFSSLLSRETAMREPLLQCSKTNCENLSSDCETRLFLMFPSLRLWLAPPPDQTVK